MSQLSDFIFAFFVFISPPIGWAKRVNDSSLGVGMDEEINIVATHGFGVQPSSDAVVTLVDIDFVSIAVILKLHVEDIVAIKLPLTIRFVVCPSFEGVTSCLCDWVDMKVSFTLRIPDTNLEVSVDVVSIHFDTELWVLCAHG